MDTLQTVGLCIAVGLALYLALRYHLSSKLTAIAALAKAEGVTIEKRVEDYTDAEIAKLTAALVARLTDTAEAIEAKAVADATIARKAALLLRVQGIAAAATVKTA